MSVIAVPVGLVLAFSVIMLVLGASLRLHRKGRGLLKGIVYVAAELLLIYGFVFDSSLWKPSMGLPAFMFMVVFFLAGLTTFIVVVWLTRKYLSNMSQSAKRMAACQIILAPFLFLIASDIAYWQQEGRHFQEYCFKYKDVGYDLTLDSRDSSAYIMKELGSGGLMTYMSEGRYSMRQVGNLVINGKHRVVTDSGRVQRPMRIEIRSDSLFDFAENNKALPVYRCK